MSEQGMEQEFLPMKLPMKRKAWEIVGDDRGGWELLDRSMEATGRPC